MSKKIKVLYVDDEMINRSHFELIFSRWYHVYIAKNANEAFEHVNQNDIDIIFSDQKLADTHGTKVLAEIHQEMGHVPKFIITGFLENEEINKAVANGIVQSVIHKPYHFNDLRQLIESCCT